MATSKQKIGTTPIRIANDVVLKIKQLGFMGETYNDVLRRVLNMHEKKVLAKQSKKDVEIVSKLR